MANITNGVHSPSLRPLSTLSIRRTRTGTTGLSTGRRTQPGISRGDGGGQQEQHHRRHVGEERPAEQPPGHHRERQPDEQQAAPSGRGRR